MSNTFNTTTASGGDAEETTDLADVIAQAAAGPKKVTTDAGSFEQHSIPDLIAADEYARAKASSSRGLGIRHIKLIPPGQD